jgi:hypothetical protein
MCARPPPRAEGPLLCVGVRALSARGPECVELHYRGEWCCLCSARCACNCHSYALLWRVRAAYPVKDSCLGCLSALRSPAIVAYRSCRGCGLECAGCDRARAEALGPQPDRGKGFALRRTGTQGRHCVHRAVRRVGMRVVCLLLAGRSCEFRSVLTLAWYLWSVVSVVVITVFSGVAVLAGADHRQPHRRQRAAPSHPRHGREDHRGVPAAHE